MTRRILFRGGPIFDGAQMLEGHALVVEDGRVVALFPDGGRHGDAADESGTAVGPGGGVAGQSAGLAPDGTRVAEGGAGVAEGGAGVADGGTGVADCTRVADGTRMAGGARVADGAPRVAKDGTLVVDLGGDILAPGFVDLQVNGGGGVMFNDQTDVDGLAAIAAAHRTLGTTALLPTLITDTPGKSRAAIEAVAMALRDGVPGIAGLHLEGPHLSVIRKGAHDAHLIRPMWAEDLEFLIDSARRLPCLKLTAAPESVTVEQVGALTRAGVRVSLGHTDAGFDTCRAYMAAGARMATHLFNAMSQLGSRTPGLVGAVLATPEVSAGLICDGIHVHPQSMRIALAAKRGPGRLYLVTDAMAPAGTDTDSFTLNGRKVLRRDGRLTLEDGTLAGADLDLLTALRVATGQVGMALPEALAMATSVPAQAAGLPAGTLSIGARADLIRIAPDLSGVSVV